MFYGTRVAQKLAHQNLLKPVKVTNYTLLSSGSKSLKVFKNGETNSQIGHCAQVLPSENFALP